MASKKLKKKLKRLKKKATKTIKSAAKVGGKALGTGLRIAAPILAATGVGLPIAAGAAVAGSALKGGSRKSKFKALKRTGIYTAGAAGVAAAAGAASGLGPGASILKSVPKIATSIFGGGGESKSGLDDAFIEGADGEKEASAFEKFLMDGVGLLGGDVKPEDMISDKDGLGSGGKDEDPAGVGAANPEELEVDPETGEVRKKGLSPLLVIGGAVLLVVVGLALMGGRKKAA